MQRSTLVIGGLIGLVSIAAFAVAFAATPNGGFKDAAAVLTIVTLLAVGIERVLEVFWTLVESKVGQWWPLSSIVKQIKDLEKSAADTVTPVFEQAKKALTDAKTTVDFTEEARTKLIAQLESQSSAVKSRLAELDKLAPTSQRTELITTTAFQAVSYAQKFAHYAERSSATLTAATSVAQQTITGAQDFLATFKDNPGRRMISVYFGSILGILVAALLGLDMFGAALAVDPTKPAGTVLGMIITGLVVGLGAGPTHSVIGVLQEIRRARHLQTLALPSVDDGAGQPAVAQATINTVMPTTSGGGPNIDRLLESLSSVMTGVPGSAGERIEGKTVGVTRDAASDQRVTIVRTGESANPSAPARPSRPSTFMLRR